MPGTARAEFAPAVLVLFLVTVVAVIVLVRASAGYRPADTPASSATPLRLDANSARWEELAALPGIGESLAQRIVEYRERRRSEGMTRPFTAIEELDEVPGIGPRTLENLEGYLRF